MDQAGIDRLELGWIPPQAPRANRLNAILPTTEMSLIARMKGRAISAPMSVPISVAAGEAASIRNPPALVASLLDP